MDEEQTVETSSGQTIHFEYGGINKKTKTKKNG
jgi:hypothetical protein